VDLEEDYVPPDVGAGTNLTHYTYNLDKQLTQIARPDGQAVSLGYDTGGRLSTVTSPRGTVGYAYDPTKGTLSSITSPDAVTLAYTYDGFLPTSGTSSGNVAGSVSWTYNDDFRVTQERVNGTNTVSFTYDNQDRLQSYGTKTYTYTANGELSTKTDTATSQTTQYTYDALGNLNQAVLPDGRQIDYLVDGRSRRVAKKVNGAFTKKFVYGDQLRIAAELSPTNAVVSRFVYATRVNVPDYLVKGSTTYRIVTDHLGSPRLVIDVSTGAIAQRMDYDEFGRVILDTNPGFQPFGFAGGLYDPDTGLVRFGARDYDAEVGRWTGKDPTEFAGGDANLYGYAVNDPLNFVDSEGASWSSALKSFAKGFVFGAAGTIVLSAAVASGTVVGAVAAVAIVGYGSYMLGTSVYELATGTEAYSGRPLSTEQRIDIGAGLGGAIVGGGFAARGAEICTGNFRIAPFGNRTGNPRGELPHHHRSIPDPANPGESIQGQGIGRHRPWDSRSTDKSIWDRF